MKRDLLFASALAGATIFASQVSAQPAAPASQPPAASSTSLGEVIVTARRLIDVPVAVSAMNAEALQRYSTVSVTTLGQQIPNVNPNPGAANQGAFFMIRGIGAFAQGYGVEQMVTANFDGVPISKGRPMTALSMFDVDSVEVLRGPQALYFGKNSPAGLIIINTTDPGFAFGGYVKAGYNDLDKRRFIEGAVDLPLSDKLTTRLAARIDDSRGYIKNTAPASQPDPLRPGMTITRAWKYGPSDDNKLVRFTGTMGAGGTISSARLPPGQTAAQKVSG